MEYRVLGKTGLRVSAIGFGGLGIGGGYGRKDKSEASRTVAKAVDFGINVFDTAPMYGDGLSEEILGEALERVRDKVVIATKPEGRGPNFIRESVEASLRRLRTDYIDILQLRDPTREKLDAFDVLETFAALKEEGKIRVGSVTIGDAQQEAQGHLSIDSGFGTVQLAYNMVYPNASKSILPRALDAGIGVIARGPLCKGFLTNRFQAKPADIQANPNFRWWTEDEADTLLAIQRDLDFLVLPGQRTLAQAAIQFVLREDTVSTTIPSMETVAEVEEIVGVPDSPPLTDSDIARIREVVAKHPPVDY